MISSQDGTDARRDRPLAAFLVGTRRRASAAEPVPAAGVSAALSPPLASAAVEVGWRLRPRLESASPATVKSPSLDRAGTAGAPALVSACLVRLRRLCCLDPMGVTVAVARLRSAKLTAAHSSGGKHSRTA